MNFILLCVIGWLAWRGAARQEMAVRERWGRSLDNDAETMLRAFAEASVYVRARDGTFSQATPAFTSVFGPVGGLEGWGERGLAVKDLLHSVFQSKQPDKRTLTLPGKGGLDVKVTLYAVRSASAHSSLPCASSPRLPESPRGRMPCQGTVVSRLRVGPYPPNGPVRSPSSRARTAKG